MENFDNVYVVYSVDKDMQNKTLYLDDPRVIETLVIGWTAANKIVCYLQEKDSSRLYGCECWTVFESVDAFIEFVADCEDED